MGQLEALLNGVHHLDPVDLSRWGGPSGVMVRPLSSAEAGQVEQLKLQGIRADVTVDGMSVNAAPVVDDISVLLEKQHQARITTVQFGLSHSGEEWSYEQASSLPAPWVTTLCQVVQRISGIEGREDSFRVLPGMDGAGADGWDDAAAPVPGWNTAGADPGRVDAAPA